MNVLLVALGGAVGCSLRYATTTITERLMPHFPLGTLVVNAVAACAVGLMLGFTQQSDLCSERVRLFVVVGLLGGLSTYSAFSAETFTMLQAQHYLGAAANVALNTGLSLGCVALGWWLATTICKLSAH
jgi:CrcB protein